MILEWIAGKAAQAAIGVFGNTFVKPFLDAWSKKQDVNLEKFKTERTSESIERQAFIASEIARVQGNNENIREAMNHKMWWWGWALFVFPVGIYHATIFAVSTLGVAPQTFAVLRVPPMQEQWAMWIVLSIFGAQTANNFIYSLIKRK